MGSFLSFGSLAPDHVVIVMAVVVLGIVLALTGYVARRYGRRGLIAVLSGGLCVLAGALIASGLALLTDDGARRQSVDSLSGELTARALAPGSALACLDAVANSDVELACEKSLFASPEQVATAVAYVDARLSILAASATLASRDERFKPSFERARRGLEADPYGLVAHVLKTRGCEPAGCAELKLLRDAAPIVANMKAHTFESRVAVYASAWSANGGAASPQGSAAAPPVIAGTAPVATAAPGAAPGGSDRKFDFPSAASIPAVSIMSAEPSGPAAAAQASPEARATTAPSSAPKRSAQGARRSSARETRGPPQPVAPPMSVLPPPAGASDPPQTSGQR